MIWPETAQFLSLDLAPMLTAGACAVACAVLGSFLLLRRQSLMGDAIAHSVLPGLAGAFLIMGTRATLPMFVGALIAGLIAAALSEGVRRLARVDSQAAMGVVFSAMFALGVVLMSLPRMRLVDLDADCVLNGVLETISWLPTAGGSGAPREWGDLLTMGVWMNGPRQMIAAIVVSFVVVAAVGAFWKELRLCSFDPALAAALGFKPGAMNIGLMVLTALVSVASFEAVGSILVIAMIICPAAAARMLTDRLSTQVVLSALIGLASSVAGYILGAFGPGWFGYSSSLSASGMMTVVAGAALVLAIVLGPEHGVLARWYRQISVHVVIAREDLLAMLYRVEEAAQAGEPLARMSVSQATAALGGTWAARRAVATAASLRLARRDDAQVLSLTDVGRSSARGIVRTHRLWELYLVREMGLRPDHVHATAMRMEHFTTPEMEPVLESAPGTSAEMDPHGKPVPRR